MVSRRGARDIEHVGSAHDEQELEALKAAAGQRLSAGQGELDLGLDAAGGEPVGSGPLQIVSSRMGHLWAGLCAAYDALGFDQAVEGVAAVGASAGHRAGQQAGQPAGAGRDRD